eukprot:m.197413 g.197413  ORF g.197413 m.197413 type:complete len:136 (-) comp17664_c1_seq1:218-625(-)
MGWMDWLADKAAKIAEVVTGRAQPEDKGSEPPSGAASPRSLNVLVRTRAGSQFFDEDGDLAHEFYEQGEDGRMRRVDQSHLTPQGPVILDKAMIDPSCPVVLFEDKLAGVGNSSNNNSSNGSSKKSRKAGTPSRS